MSCGVALLMSDGSTKAGLNIPSELAPDILGCLLFEYGLRTRYLRFLLGTIFFEADVYIAVLEYMKSSL